MAGIPQLVILNHDGWYGKYNIKTGVVRATGEGSTVNIGGLQNLNHDGWYGNYNIHTDTVRATGEGSTVNIGGLQNLFGPPPGFGFHSSLGSHSGPTGSQRNGHADFDERRKEAQSRFASHAAAMQKEEAAKAAAGNTGVNRNIDVTKKLVNAGQEGKINVASGGGPGK